MSCSARKEENETFLEKFIRFLQFDLSELLFPKAFSNLENGVSSLDDMDNVILHNYGDKWKIVNGALDRNNDGIIRKSCEARNTNHRNVVKETLSKAFIKKCDNKLINLAQNINMKMNKKKVNYLVKSIQKLWNDFVSKSGKRDETCKNWWDLKSYQKLSFYWTAIANQILQESPLDNFKTYYYANKKHPLTKTRKADEQMLIFWYSMTDNQKLPFVVESLIARISHGKVNIQNEHEIQRALTNLQDNI